MRVQFRSFALAASIAATTVAGCSRPPDLIGIDDPAAPAESIPDVTRHRVFIITTRAASEVVGAFFSGARAPELGLASVDVTVPPTHVVGQLERSRSLPPDPRKYFAVVDPMVFPNRSGFVSQIDRELATRPASERKVLLFVHGYNNTTSDAVLRLTQFVQDTDYSGVPVLFTWASAASAPRYVYDLNSALVARAKIPEMGSILQQTNARDVDIFAHSMGCLLTMEGLVDAAQDGRLGNMTRIKHIILAAPDIDLDLFRSQLSQLPESVRNKIYILVSKDDAALRFSRVIAGGVPRVGATDATVLEQLGVTVIDLSQVDDSSSGSHSKFAGSPEVVQLIGAGLSRSTRFGVEGNQPLDRILNGVPIRIFGQ